MGDGSEPLQAWVKRSVPAIEPMMVIRMRRAASKDDAASRRHDFAGARVGSRSHARPPHVGRTRAVTRGSPRVGPRFWLLARGRAPVLQLLAAARNVRQPLLLRWARRDDGCAPRRASRSWVA